MFKVAVPIVTLAIGRQLTLTLAVTTASTRHLAQTVTTEGSDILPLIPAFFLQIAKSLTDKPSMLLVA